MPQPEGAQLTQSVSPMLTSMAINLLPKLENFVAKQIFPNVPVASPSGKYNVWLPDDFLRRQMKKLANYEAPPIGGFATSSGTFAVNRYGESTLYTSQDLADARRGGTSDQMLISSKVRYVTTQALLELEMQTASVVTTGGNWGLAVTGVTSGAVGGTSFLQWDQAASTPIDDILDLKERIRLKTGFEPNELVLPQQVWLALRKNAQLMGRIIYDGQQNKPAQVSLQQMRSLFEIDNIIIAKGVYNSAAEGQTATFAYIWGKYVWLGYVAQAPGITEPSAGYHFSWTGDTTVGLPAGMSSGEGPANFGAVQSPEGIFILSYMENRPRAQFIDAELFTTPNVTASTLGCLMSAVIA